VKTYTAEAEKDCA